MRRRPKLGEKVCIKGYENLPFHVVAVRPGEREPVVLQHPFTGAVMAFALRELSEHRPTTAY